MEKKTYIKPEIEVVEMEIESPMLTGSQDDDIHINFGEGLVESETEQLSVGRTRRGKWGNLWYTED